MNNEIKCMLDVCAENKTCGCGCDNVIKVLALKDNIIESSWLPMSSVNADYLSEFMNEHDAEELGWVIGCKYCQSINNEYY